jgi:hypothetical protein
MLRLLLLATLVTASFTLGGCAQLMRDGRDAPWDPRGSKSLLDQLPNWDNAAWRRCGAHLPEHQRSPGQTDRC